MYKLLILTTIFSCASIDKTEMREKYKEPSFCKNTLQHDIHRNECLR